jgi:hypothetical protein
MQTPIPQTQHCTVQMTTRFPLEPPRKPKPVYNIFCQVERAKILGLPLVLEERQRKTTAQKRKHRKTHGKISFTELSKHVSSKWRALRESEKQVYKAIYKKNMDEYKHELEEYNHLVKKMNEQQHTTVRTVLRATDKGDAKLTSDKSMLGPSSRYKQTSETSRKKTCLSERINASMKELKINTEQRKMASLENDFQLQPVSMGDMLSRTMSDVERDLMAYTDFLQNANFALGDEAVCAKAQSMSLHRHRQTCIRATLLRR